MQKQEQAHKETDNIHLIRKATHQKYGRDTLRFLGGDEGSRVGGGRGRQGLMGATSINIQCLPRHEYQGASLPLVVPRDDYLPTRGTPQANRRLAIRALSASQDDKIRHLL